MASFLLTFACLSSTDSSQVFENALKEEINAEDGAFAGEEIDQEGMTFEKRASECLKHSVYVGLEWT